MSRNRSQFGNRTRGARRGIGSYDTDWQRPLKGDSVAKDRGLL